MAISAVYLVPKQFVPWTLNKAYIYELPECNTVCELA